MNDAIDGVLAMSQYPDATKHAAARTNPGLFVCGCGDVHGAWALRLEVEHVEGFRVARVPHLPFAHLRGHAWDELRLRAYDGIYVGKRARLRCK